MALWNWIRAVIGTKEFHYLIGYLLRALVATESPGILHFDEIRDRLNDRTLIYLDVRNRSELLVDGKIVGSVNIPEPELEDAFDKNDDEFFIHYGFCKPNKGDENFVVACHSGGRAISSVDKLRRLGYGSIKIYQGSFLDWKARGGFIVK
uniref:Rhodanese domain-containing protein n=1 Tax=Daphnia galeata TaxID=27404 RepID=A0A8J2WEG3_9CRUS|nr:unnamed protein product [Daphnia galeata]